MPARQAGKISGSLCRFAASGKLAKPSMTTSAIGWKWRLPHFTLQHRGAPGAAEPVDKAG